MIWVFLALLTALVSSSQDAWVKGKFGTSTHEMVAFPMAYSIPLLAAALLLIDFPDLDHVFYWTFIITLPFNGIAVLMHTRAIKISPLSLTLPYLAFTPVFMLVTGAVLLGEVPSTGGVFGVIVIVIGSYVLNVDPGSYTLFSPFKALFREKGSMIMLVVAFIFSLTAALGKKAILHSSVMFFSVLFFLVLNLIILLIMIMTGRISMRQLASRPVPGSVAGLLLFAHVVCHGWAISMTKAVYMISLKRMSILFGVIYGGVFFSERHLGYRLAGTVLMIFGAAVVSLKGR